MSSSASTQQPAAKSKAPVVEGSGIQLTAVKIYNSTFKSELEGAVKALAEKGDRLKLVGILGTDKEDAAMYAEFTKRSCLAVGIEFELRKVGKARDAALANGEEVEQAITDANDDPEVNGIMVYYPIFGGTQDQYLQQVVSSSKDVEGLNHQFLFNLYHNIRFIYPRTLKPPKSDSPSAPTTALPGTFKSILPCTPLAIVKCLEHAQVYSPLLPFGDRARGKVIAIINRSEVVGRPLAALLANDGARVLSIDITGVVEFSKRPTRPGGNNKYEPRHVTTPVEMTTEEAVRMSDVVISAVPGGKFKVKNEWLKDGVIAVEVAGDKNFEADVITKASIYVPAVGKLTIAMLQRNLIRLREYQRETPAES